MNKRNTHLLQAHALWKTILFPGDTAIDATIGNGYDLLCLAEILQGQGKLIGYDIQPQALFETKKCIDLLPQEQQKIISLYCRSHTEIEEKKVKLIVYNLGYLPKGNKAITTTAEETIPSLQKALSISNYISLTCYPGHPAGAIESQAIQTFLQTLPKEKWSLTTYIGGPEPHTPYLIWIKQISLHP